MARIHIVLQGKGGVGKSLVAALLAQYLISHGQTPLCIDMDATNATFYRYQAFAVERFPQAEADDRSAQHVDALIERIVATIDAIARNHGVILGRDDPIMMLKHRPAAARYHPSATAGLRTV